MLDGGQAGGRIIVYPMRAGLFFLSGPVFPEWTTILNNTNSDTLTMIYMIVYEQQSICLRLVSCALPCYFHRITSQYYKKRHAQCKQNRSDLVLKETQ